MSKMRLTQAQRLVLLGLAKATTGGPVRAQTAKALAGRGLIRCINAVEAVVGGNATPLYVVTPEGHAELAPPVPAPTPAPEVQPETKPLIEGTEGGLQW
jgi:hypothetical protein